MAIEITDEGIITDTLDEIILDLENKMKEIFGDDINVDQNTFDGQLINIFAQYGFDIQQVFINLYNSTNINYAEGTALESLCYSITNRRRKAGTKTIVEVNVTTSLDNITLNGVGSSGEIFTLADDAGNNFQLQSTQILATAGVHSLTFIAEEVKEITILPGAITTIVTPKVGVDSVNNVGVETTTGTDTESDEELRRGFKFSVSQASNGWINGLKGTLLSLSGVETVTVYENFTFVTSPEGIPGKSVFIIVDGGDPNEIAQGIVNHKGAGCGMHGDEEVDIKLDDGDVKTVNFGRPIAQNLTIRIDVKEEAGKHDLIESTLLGVKYNLSDIAKVQDYYEAVQQLDGVIINIIEISLNGIDYFNVIEPVELTDLFVSNTVVFV